MKTYQKSVFGRLNGQDIFSYTFENEQGWQLTVMTYGATVLRYVTPDRAGHFANVILGFDRFEDYIGNSPKHGASIGPVAGRIAGASFDLNGQRYQLETNNGRNCNHSGSTGWDSAVFETETVTDEGLTLYTERPDGTGGFPGHLKVWVSYRLTEQGAVEMDYRAESDQDTLLNPTNHSYFNLSGDSSRPVDDHFLQLHTRGVYPIAPDGLPEKTPDSSRDFVRQLAQGALLGDIFAASDEQIELVSGLDHPFALGNGRPAGQLHHPASGRSLSFETGADCLVIYSANVVDETVRLQGRPMIQHNGLALEMQSLPDAIHSEQKETVILRAGQVFRSRTVYRAAVSD